MKTQWIFCSVDDPRNATIAEWAGWMAAVEWLALVGISILMPSGFAPHPWWHLMANGVFMFLLFAGYRGFTSGHVRKLGSLGLLVTNLILLLLFGVITVIGYLRS